jgi:(1->4)-alpha-D-glucan 1-alpha-D-glucosylmutase
MQNFQDFFEEYRGDLREFVMKFQQITGPVMAKSVEDTAFYVYNRLTSLNEVGGHPNHFGFTVADFHEHNIDKAYPYTMLSTSTHDTKRSEDLRTRISVLSEMPSAWNRALTHWAFINEAAKTEVNEQLAPSRNDEYLLYQTLLGAFHEGVDDDETFVPRIVAYMHKAINEAKMHSNWINPNDEYAQAIADFVKQIWESGDFRASFGPLQQQVAYFGRFNSLSQVLLKLTAPGMPDVYQGNELWDYSLVDPDNRRPVDFDHRQALLNQIQAEEADDRTAFAQRLLDDITSGMIKMYLTYRTLNYRREHETLFSEGAYVPIEVEGEKADHVCAYLRVEGDDAMLVVVPRLILTLTDGEERPPTGDVWKDTALLLPESVTASNLENLFTDEQLSINTAGQRHTLALSDVLNVFPVALLQAPASTDA